MIGTNRTHRKSGRGLLIGLASVVILAAALRAAAAQLAPNEEG